MTLPAAPPIWKAIVIYYAAICLVFAIIGVVGAGGDPAGAVVGLGIAALSHFVPFVRPPPIDPRLFLLLAFVVIGLGYVALRKLSGWARIGVVITLLLAWLCWGFVALAISA